MNRYDVTFQSDDGRVWQVTVRADGITESRDLVIFWRGWMRRRVHFIAKDALISVIADKDNK